MGDWHPFDDGRSIGLNGTEGGVILRDDEHPDGSRITLERGGHTPFSITCGVYGWMVHTRFFPGETEAQNAFEEMRPALVDVLNVIPLADELDDETIKTVSDALTDFTERFP
jgi:hypothetical protein